MPLFEYTGLDAAGKERSGFLEAANVISVKRILFEHGIFVSKLRGLEKKQKNGPINLNQCALITRQIALFLKMGFTLDEAFSYTSDSWKKGSIQKKLKVVAHLLKEGLNLERALKESYLFPSFVLRVLAVAEKSGKLIEVLEMLASYCDKKYQFRNLWIQGLLYPGLLLVVSFGVLFIIINWVFPSFIDLFKEMNKTLPWQTQMILKVSQWLSRYSLFILGAVFVLGGGIVYHYKHQRAWWIQFALKIPGLEVILKKRNACEISQNITLLLKGGFQVPESFSFAGEGHPFIQDELLRFRLHLEEGKEYKNGLLHSIFPKEFLTLICAGFRSGTLAETCLKVSAFYERDLETFFSRFITLLGPMMLLGVGVLIGFLVIGVLLPIFEWSF